MLAPDSETVTRKIPSILCSCIKSRTKASVSREAVPLPMAMARTLCFATKAASFCMASVVLPVWG